ncbi:hypothetical protein trd_1949 [Thermomicrobium roseum DSM 5159]|uniref:Uncharacterized protein n=1 Tax=Thermomicrobium roseum (strain ATCC 27502 / DSM 5159 / P-2) TaxID=309801 RepID=B9L2Q7_THERP|nr:hypothetical protein trd_1949 [Thermomicrobium roseum DSM 5159]
MRLQDGRSEPVHFVETPHGDGQAHGCAALRVSHAVGLQGSNPAEP